MKNSINVSKLIALVAVLGISASVTTLSADENKDSSNSKAAKAIEIPKSVFDPSPSAGKDPFYPKSTRRNQQIITEPTPEPVTDVTKSLKLKGISGSLDEKLAIINNRTFAVGESDYIDIGTVKVHVLLKEIRQESVIVVVNNAHYKELKLRDGV